MFGDNKLMLHSNKDNIILFNNSSKYNNLYLRILFSRYYKLYNNSNIRNIICVVLQMQHHNYSIILLLYHYNNYGNIILHNNYININNIIFISNNDNNSNYKLVNNIILFYHIDNIILSY